MRAKVCYVRTTLAIDDGVLLAAKAMARQQDRSVGEVITDRARRSLRRPRAGGECNGIPLLSRVRSLLSERQAGYTLPKIYLGVEYRLVVRMNDGSKVNLRSRDVTSVAAMKAGDRIGMAWTVGDIVVIVA
jgi:hypothetical protein